MSQSNAVRSVVVTGAFGVLGRAVANGFSERGYRVALLDQAQPSAQLQAEFGAPHCVLGNVDLAVPEAAAMAMQAAKDAFGAIAVLVNVAGGFQWQKLEHSDSAIWEQMFAVNLKTTVIATKAALPHLVQSSTARIVNVGAAAAARPAGAGMSAYTASKAGVHKLTESLAEELSDRGVTVNAVLPGIIDTPRNRADMPTADFTRWVTPAAVAEVIVFLASERASAVNGALIPVTGRG